MSDLVRDLREYADAIAADRGYDTGATYAMRDAAVEIAALEGRVVAAEQALARLQDFAVWVTRVDRRLANFARAALTGAGLPDPGPASPGSVAARTETIDA